MVDKYIDSNICPLPWTSLEIGVNGGAAPCCLYKGQVPDVKVYKTNLKAIQQSQYMEDLRTQFKNGEKPAGCNRCWLEEDAGKTSKRMNSFYKMKNSLQNWTPDNKPTLKFIDFKLGNVCNLKCRICGSWSSSKWAQEEMDYGENPVARKHLTEGGWPKKNPQFFEDIKEVLEDVEYFEFTGGEPFMIHNHFKILEHCVEKGYAKNQDIHYNTNGTQLPGRDIALWVKQFDPNYFYVNTCFDPPYFNIQTLPKQIKNIVNARYSDLKDFQPTIRFMNSAHTETEEIKENRKERILQTDTYRKEHFGDVFPLLNNVLGIYE